MDTAYNNYGPRVIKQPSLKILLPSADKAGHTPPHPGKTIETIAKFAYRKTGDMETVNRKIEMQQTRMYRDQLITAGDLENLKTELLNEFKKLVKEISSQPSKQWLKSPEVRKLLGISSNTLTNLRVNGSLPYTKIGGVIYYEYEDIRKMFNRNKSKNGS